MLSKGGGGVMVNRLGSCFGDISSNLILYNINMLSKTNNNIFRLLDIM